LFPIRRHSAKPAQRIAVAPVSVGHYFGYDPDTDGYWNVVPNLHCEAGRWNERRVGSQIRYFTIVARKFSPEKSAATGDLQFGSRYAGESRGIRIHGGNRAASLGGLLSAEGHGTSISAVDKKAGCVCRRYIKKKAARGEDCQPGSTNNNGMSGNHATLPSNHRT
jgi:hypothetical protein